MKTELPEFEVMGSMELERWFWALLGVDRGDLYSREKKWMAGLSAEARAEMSRRVDAAMHKLVDARKEAA